MLPKDYFSNKTWEDYRIGFGAPGNKRFLNKLNQPIRAVSSIFFDCKNGADIFNLINANSNSNSKLTRTYLNLT